MREAIKEMNKKRLDIVCLKEKNGKINIYSEYSKARRRLSSQKISKLKPDIIFHFAAQAILSESYKNPIDTVNVNTIGSLNILHSASFLKKKCVCVMITSDKCYYNIEKKNGYKENSVVGGKGI